MPLLLPSCHEQGRGDGGTLSQEGPH